MKKHAPALICSLMTACLAVTVLSLTLGGGPVRVRAASPVYVRTDGDDSECNGTADAPYSASVAPACALRTIQQGAYAADANGTVIVREGVYTESVWIGRDITLQGAGAGSAIIDANGTGSGFYIADGTDATITGVTVRDGFGYFGGGIDNRGNLTVTHSIVSGNGVRDDGDGGGIFNLGGRLLIKSSIVVGNTADRGGGGVFSLGELIIVDSDILSNTAADGGGVLNSDGTMRMINSRVHGNHAFDAVAYGGGLFNHGVADLRQVTVSGNSATYTDTIYPRLGGGIHNQGVMTLTNCTISDNTADYGGAISNGGDQLVISSCTLARNNVVAGSVGPGAISNHGAITTTNTIIADNGIANCLDEGTMRSAGHNLESADDCGFDAAGDLVNTDPRLGPLQDNGGLPTASGQPPWTHALRGGSPAIDAGGMADCPPTDQRGVVRPVDGDLDDLALCDIGAYEFTLFEVHLPLTVRSLSTLAAR
jgi:hypothetical protein